MDNHTREQRHINMTHIKSISSLEVCVRKYLFSQGFRYRKNCKELPGKPDIVLPKYKTVIFVNGCFWHHHMGCKKAVFPKTNQEYWEAKLIRNQQRDLKNYEQLRNKGWEVIVLWECELSKNQIDKRLNQLVQSLKTH